MKNGELKNKAIKSRVKRGAKSVLLAAAAALLAALFLISAAACGGQPAAAAATEATTTTVAASTAAATEAAAQAQAAPLSDKAITIVSREEGSGTRGAFVELFGVLDENKNDNMTQNAEITNNTAVMMTSISGNKDAIGYISLGSLNDTVKAVKIDGVVASADNINNGSYKISRPFMIATKGEVSAQAQDFIDYILSSDGQAVIGGKQYIEIPGSGEPYQPGAATGKITVAGSSSVTPIMEVLKEEYQKLNPDVEIDIQQSDSSTGMNNTIDGVCDIGMASRELKDSETEKGLAGTLIAMDGIAVIVHNDSAVDSLTKDQVKAIFMGEAEKWSDLG